MAYPPEWSQQTSFIVVDATRPSLVDELHRRGFENVLLTCPTEEALRELRAKLPEARSDLTCARVADAIRGHPDVLVLDGSSISQLSRPGRLRSAGYVAFPVSWSAKGLTFTLWWLVNTLVGRFRRPRIALSGRGPALLIARNRRQRPLKARRLIPHKLGVEGFFKELDARGVDYVVLRWFEDLPELAVGEDVDILVRDESLEEVHELLAQGPGVVPIDVYSVTGLPRSDYRNMAYYPPYLAEEILDGAEHRGVYKVPNPEHHFLSLAYHALYHKGDDSGLPDGEEISASEADGPHSYPRTLAGLRDQLGQPTAISKEGLGALLQEKGWTPPHDTLHRLAQGNSWLERTLEGPEPGTTTEAGLACFLVRKRADEAGATPRILRLLENNGFDVLRTRALSDTEVATAARRLRGGNWARTPQDPSWDPPSTGIAAWCLLPTTPNARQRERYPLLTNARILVKDAIRDIVNEEFATDGMSFVIHSADNAQEAEYYLDVLFPGKREEIHREGRSLEARFATREPVEKTLTRWGCNAKVEVVEFQGKRAVKKTFRPGRGELLRNELDAMRTLGAEIPEIPEVLASGDGYFIVPYYEDALRFRLADHRLLPYRHASALVALLRRFWDLGYAHLDAHPENLVVDPERGLKIVDFEFSHRYGPGEKPSRFEESWDLSRAPERYDGGLPLKGAFRYQGTLEPALGLTARSAVHDPPWLQHVKRTAYRLVLLRRRLRVGRRRMRRNLRARLRSRRRSRRPRRDRS